MKKTISLLLIVLILLFNLAGCSSNKKSEEQLKEEIKAQLKAEIAQEQEKANAHAASQEAPKVDPADVKDRDALYRFINYYIAPDIAINNFNECEIVYADITGNGSDEAVIVSPNVNWFKNVELITGDNGKFESIPSDIPLAKYNTRASFEDGFLSVIGATGGTGELISYMNLYIYDGSKMIMVLEGLDLVHNVDFPDARYVEHGDIKGSLKDFTFTITKHDNITGKENVTKKEQYTYNANTKSFEVKPADPSQSSVSSGGGLYLSQLKNGDSIGGGLLIRDIKYKKGRDKASFILIGTVVLEGELSYSEMYEQIVFDTTKDNGAATILIEYPDNYTAEFRPGESLGFVNYNAITQALSPSDLSKIKNGQPKTLKIRVKDIEYSGAYQSEWGSSCEFISIEN